MHLDIYAIATLFLGLKVFSLHGHYLIVYNNMYPDGIQNTLLLKGCNLQYGMDK